MEFFSNSTALAGGSSVSTKALATRAERFTSNFLAEPAAS